MKTYSSSAQNQDFVKGHNRTSLRFLLKLWGEIWEATDSICCPVGRRNTWDIKEITVYPLCFSW